MARITINGVSLDPLAQAPALAAAGLDTPDTSTSNYVLVQTAEPLTDAQRTELGDLGVDIQEYVPDDTYLCRYAPADLSPVRALPFVTWAGAYLRGFKINPTLRPTPPDAAAAVLPGPLRQPPSRRRREVEIVLHDDVDPTSDAVRNQVAAAAKVNAADLRTGQHKVRVTVEEGRLDALAALDEVRQIEQAPKRQLFNNVARGILNADVVVNSTPYKGKGQLVGVADTGFDRGSTSNVHPAFTGRVKKLYPLGRPSPARSDDPDGHGTHVCGSVLGDGNAPSMGGKIQGTAPEAHLVLQSLLDSGGNLGGIPVDLHDLFQPVYDNDGVRVHTNSWGTPVTGYAASSQEIDDFVWNHQDMVILYAAGNEGTDANSNGVVDQGSISQEPSAKNCITVGATESQRPDFEPTYGTYWPSDFPTNPLNSDQQANDPDGMAAFSSRGPTKEQRFKPDVVAPGTCILSTLSRRVATTDTTFGTSSDPRFFFDTGTSMATPLVAGCAAVLRETLVRNGTADPSAALIKALIVNGAVEVDGQYSPTEAGASPNNNSGFGRVNLAGSVIIPGPPGSAADAGFGEGGPLKQGDEDSFTITIPDGPPHGHGAVPAALGATFKMTLVWTDPPGAALQNDLDLVVRAANGDERHGNMGIGKGFDRRNNVEQIRWVNLPPGPATITIRAFRITRFPQPYAWVWRLS
jgi:hypothetical protein